jgi:PAS domain S-box-containing protein
MDDEQRILIVDDDTAFTKTLSDILSTEGLAPLVVADGKTAVERSAEHSPMVAVIDLVLQDSPGLEVMKGIKELSRDTQCIVLTGHASQQSAIEAANLGAYSYLLKPVDIDQLLLTIRRAAEKAEAERALRESEEKYRLVVQNAGEGIALLDLDGNFLEANPKALEITGLGRDEVVGRNLAEVLPRLGLQQSALEQLIQDRMRGGPLSSMELTITNASGQRTHMLARTSLVKKEGQLSGLSVILEDITEHKRAEHELRQLKDFNESIVQNMAEGVAVMDAQGSVTFANPALAAMWGCRPEELMGKHWTEIVPPDQHSIIRAADERRLSGESDRYEVQQVRKDGTRFRTLVSGTPRFEEGKFVGTMAVITDITQLAEAHEEISKLSQFQKSIIDNANVWLDVLDEGANVVIWNKAAEEISGYSRAEVVGHDKIWEWLYPDREYREEITAASAAIIQQGQVMEGSETTIRRKDGKPRTISWHSRNLLDAEGRPIGSIALGRDVTEHRRAEEALRESEEKYRNLVEMASDGIAILQHSLLRYVNPALTDMIGYDAQELIDRPFADYIWPDDLPLVRDRHQARPDGQKLPATYEADLIHRSGERVPVELNAGAITYQREFADLVIFRNITERKRAEAETQRRAEEQQRRLAEMTALYDTSLEMVGQQELPTLFQSLLQRALGLLETQAGAIWLYRPQERELELVADCGLEESQASGRLAIGEGVAGKVLQTGEAGAIADYRNWEGRSTRPYTRGTRAVLSAPLKWGEETVGVVSLYETDRIREWDDHEVRLLTLLANQAAAAIQNARLYEETVRTAEELGVLYDVSLEMASQLDLPSLLDTVVRRAIDLLGGFAGGMYMYDAQRGDMELIAAVWPGRDPGGVRLALGEGVCGKVAENGEPLVITDYANWEGRAEQFDVGPTFNVLSVPVKRGQKLLGALYVNDYNVDRRFDEADIRLATMFANQAAVAIENARLLNALQQHQEELQRLSAQLMNAQEEERKRISQELHDELGQSLTAMSINLAAIRALLPEQLDHMALERLDETTGLVDETLDRVRDLSLELRPSMLDDLGLVPTLRWYVSSYEKRAGVDVVLHTINLDERLAPEMETVLYRVVQEALTNVARHAQASVVRARLERTGHTINVLLEDDGIGFDERSVATRDASQRGAGLVGIRERVSSQGGTLDVHSQPGQGTHLTIQMPLSD